jgi:hypothetical protein
MRCVVWVVIEQLCAEPDGQSRLVLILVCLDTLAAQKTTSILQLTGIQRAQAYQNISHQSPVNAAKLYEHADLLVVASSSFYSLLR